MKIISKIKNRIKWSVYNDFERNDWIKCQLSNIDPGLKILDAGCGSQRYKAYCSHLVYKSQDCGQYEKDNSPSLIARTECYRYGKLDYTGNIWDINEENESFNAILCSEVLEHIPYPSETLMEFSRLLKSGGILILTIPSNSLRHMDPYYFSSGYSNRYLEYFLRKYGFREIRIKTVGNYHRWLLIEVFRTIRMERWFFKKLMLLPAFVYYYFKQINPTLESINTLCLGYFITAKKK